MLPRTERRGRTNAWCRENMHIALVEPGKIGRTLMTRLLQARGDTVAGFEDGMDADLFPATQSLRVWAGPALRFARV